MPRSTRRATSKKNKSPDDTKTKAKTKKDEGVKEEDDEVAGVDGDTDTGAGDSCAVPGSDERESDVRNKDEGGDGGADGGESSGGGGRRRSSRKRGAGDASPSPPPPSSPSPSHGKGGQRGGGGDDGDPRPGRKKKRLGRESGAKKDRGGDGDPESPDGGVGGGEDVATGEKEGGGSPKEAVVAKAKEVDSDIDIDALYARATGTSYFARRGAIQEMEERGVLETTLWPLCLRSARGQLSNERDSGDGGADSKQFTDKHAFLMALLVNCRGSVGGGSSSPLSFIAAREGEGDEEASETERARAFETFLALVLSHELPIGRYDLEAERVHFVARCASSFDAGSVVSRSVLRLTGLSLWSAMDPRRRELELARYPALRRHWDKYAAETEAKAGESAKAEAERAIPSLGDHEATFIPSLVAKLLRALESPPLSELGGDDDGHGLGRDATKIAVHEDEQDEEDAAGDTERGRGDDDDESKGIAKSDRSSRRRGGGGGVHIRVASVLAFVHRTLEFLADLLSQLPTRRFLRAFLLDACVTVRCGLSNLASDRSRGRLFRQLLEILIDLENFAIDDQTGRAITPAEMMALTNSRCHALQRMCHKHYADKLTEFAFAGVNMAGDRDFLTRHLAKLDDSELLDLARRMRLVGINSDLGRDDADADADAAGETGTSSSSSQSTPSLHRLGRSFLLSLLVYRHASRPSEAATLASLPVYPNEVLLWDGNVVPPGTFPQVADRVLALPKMNLQFLTLHDYLLRSFKLFRLESAYEIRGDIVDAVRRTAPTERHEYDDGENDYDGGVAVDVTREVGTTGALPTTFKGWARMAIELQLFRLVKVAPPRLGETVPSSVLAEIVIDLKALGGSIRAEWDDIREHDNLFLVAVDASKMTGAPAPFLKNTTHWRMRGRDRRVPDEEDVTFPERFGVVAVRGCVVLEMRDEAGNLLNDPAAAWQEGGPPAAKGTKRFLKVALDAAQFASDGGGGSSLGAGVYQTLNLVVRRKAKENNFKAVLETIRDLMNSSSAVSRCIPPWFHDVLLGYGDPSSATYSSKRLREYARKTAGVTSPEAELDYGDTFVDKLHIQSSFPGFDIVFEQSAGLEKTESRLDRCRYRIKIEDEVMPLQVQPDAKAPQKMKALSYPFEPNVKGNRIRFTPRQVEAVRSGMSPGVTLVVGPPGTGKTDVAVQIIANLFHSFPTQRTVIVTHSNAALNDLFEKVMARGDIEERYMLRLGAGERDLQTTSSHDFTKAGRVAHTLERRGVLLEAVQCLSESLGVSSKGERGADGQPSYTCETAAYFDLHHIQKRIQIFEREVKSMGPNHLEEDVERPLNVASIFPFKEYFGMVKCNDLALDVAREKFSNLNAIFTELTEYRPLELLRSQRQRTDYLLTKQARIVAMTCTHAAIARSHLVELGFKYDNILMEEAGQMLEVETFIPFLLQKGESDNIDSCRLKRVCLIGDHHQLPPVVKNMAFQRFSHLDQSLFSRLIRLGVPHTQLNRQGRARAEIAQLYSWRYRDLGNLDNVLSSSTYLSANAGFVHTFQMVDVGDFEGRGESTPSAFYYQNLGEAEYVVALFQYMVLIGYPAEKISILTTYNGQKDLIQDIVAQRCGVGTPLAGVRPGAVSTVDQYQGQQNDYVLLSLVRTTNVGHLRDVRRLVVAVSRARLGLYVFCRKAVFEACHELRNTMNIFSEKPSKLQLITDEHFPSTRKASGDEVQPKNIFQVDDLTSLGNIVHSMQRQICPS